MEGNSVEELKRKPSLMLYMAALAAQMGSISMGCTLGWSGPALADMARNDSRPHLTNDSGHDLYLKTWIGSSMTVGALFGSLLCGFLIDTFGRRKTLIVLGIPYTIGWALLSFGREVWILIIGRITTGFCTGIILGTLPVYVTEISTPNIRGLLGMAFNMFGVVGILYMDVLSLWMSWDYIALAAIIPSVLLSLSMFYMPESPNWLINKYGISAYGAKALQDLRHPNSDLEQELQELEEQTLVSENKADQRFDYGLLIRQDVYKPIIIGIIFQFFHQFSGINALQFYLTDIFKDSGSLLEPEYAVIAVNTAMLLACLLGSFLIDILGRKILLMLSGAGHMLSIGVLGYYYYENRASISSTLANSSIDSQLTENAMETHELSLVPVICLAIFVTSFSIGYGPVIWIIITEICNSNVVGVVISFMSVSSWVLKFIVTKEFEDFNQLLGKYGTFWMFSAISGLSILFAIYVPETKGKSLEEIQKTFYPKLYDINNKDYHKIMSNKKDAEEHDENSC